MSGVKCCIHQLLKILSMDHPLWELSSYFVSHNLLVSSNPTIVKICCVLVSSLGLPNPKKAGERVEDGPRSFTYKIIRVYWWFYLYGGSIPIEKCSLSVSIGIGDMVSDGRDTPWTAFNKPCYDFCLRSGLGPLVLHGDFCPPLICLLLDSGASLDASVWVIPATAEWCFCFSSIVN